MSAIRQRVSRDRPSVRKRHSRSVRAVIRTIAAGLLALSSILLLGCEETGGDPMDTVKYVDLERFMGDWYVVANIPTFLEKKAYNPLEQYKLNPDGTIATTFTFNEGALDGPLKTFRPKGFVLDETSNARWGMRFVWPIKADFRIVYLDDAYETTVIGRTKRDYVWVMSRTPDFSDADFERMKTFVGSLGYDTSKLQRPQHGPG
jgi:apolipoprotein D and lipocalin family protein